MFEPPPGPVSHRTTGNAALFHLYKYHSRPTGHSANDREQRSQLENRLRPHVAVSPERQSAVLSR
jgi:hypothetical protein